MNFRNHKLGLKMEELFPIKTLKTIHYTISHCLNTQYQRRCEIFRTESEKIALAQIKKATKLKCYTSFWIGHRNIDIFFPQISNGLAIEIDGPIHNTLRVTKSDNSKFDMLSALGINVLVLKNEDLKTLSVFNLINSLNKQKITDSRARKRVLTKVYLKTLLNNLEVINLDSYLSPEAIKALPSLQIHFQNFYNQNFMEDKHD